MQRILSNEANLVRNLTLVWQLSIKIYFLIKSVLKVYEFNNCTAKYVYNFHFYQTLEILNGLQTV
jgi:hypothetical protein